MTAKRINFKAMDCDQFIAYLEEKSISFEHCSLKTFDNKDVIEIKPLHFRLIPRVFGIADGKQLFEVIYENNTNKLLKQFISIVNDKIQNMSTKGVYHPRRLQPKWQSLNTNEEKLELFRKYMKAPTSSIGFLRLIEVNLPNKTMESIIIDYPEFEELIGIDGLRHKCINKFKLYKNGKTYLKSKQLL